MSLTDNNDVDLETYEVTFDRPANAEYAQVIFPHVSEYYPTDAHVECRYEIRPTLVANARDWIGLFKVGWSAVRDYVYFHWVKLPAEYQGGRQVNSEVLFMCHNLPKDDGEYYQFCYVTKEGLVRGASTPFQFRRPGSDDFVTVEDDDSDILFVTTRTVALEERLNKALTSVRDMENAKTSTLAEKELIEVKLHELDMALDAEKDKNDSLAKEKQELTDKMAAMENEMKDLAQVQENAQEKVLFTTKEKEEILKRLEENEVYIKALQVKIKALLAEKDMLTGKQKMLEEERELYKNHFTSSESTIQGYLREICDLKKSLHDESLRRGQLEQKVPQLEADLEKEKKVAATQTAYAKSAMEKLHVIQEKLKNCEDKLMAVEHCKMMLNEEVIAVHDAHDKMATTLEKALGEAHSLKSQICHLEEDNEKNANTLRTEIAALQKQNASLSKTEQELRQKLKAYEDDSARSRRTSEGSVCREEEEGAHYALKLAQVHLEKTLAKYKRKYDELKGQVDETRTHQRNQEGTEKDLREEIHDLKDRLAMGAEEYKMKFIECKRLQKELRKLKKQTGEDTGPCTPEREHQQLQQSGSPSKSRRESCTQVDEELAVGEEAAWQNHLDTYKRILDTRYTNLYKQELKAKQNENSALMNRHREELADYRQLAENQGELLTKIERESHMKCQTLKDIIAKQRSEIRRLEEKQKCLIKQESQSEAPEPASSRNPWSSPNMVYPTIDLQRMRRQTPSAPAWPPSQWLEKGAESKEETDWPKCVGKRSADSGKARPEKKLRELARSSSEPRVQEEKTGDSAYVLAQEPPSGGTKVPLRRLVDNKRAAIDTPVLETEALQFKERPFRPLPPPIEPIVLPSAKLAAIRARTDTGSDSGMNNIFDRLDQLEITGNDGEHEEERFQDAAGEPQKICPVCTTAFPADIHQFQFEDHVESHYGPVCPICYRQFPDECQVKDYEDHVHSHFRD